MKCRSGHQWRDYLRALIAMQIVVVVSAVLLALLYLVSAAMFSPSTASMRFTGVVAWRMLIDLLQNTWLPATLTALLVAGPLYALRGPTGKTTWWQILLWGALAAGVGWCVGLSVSAFDFDWPLLSNLKIIVGVLLLYGCPSAGLYGLLFGVCMRYLPGESDVPATEPTLFEKLTAGYNPPLDVAAWRVFAAFQGAIIIGNAIALLVMLALVRDASAGALVAATVRATGHVLLYLNLSGLFLAPLVALRLWGLDVFPGRMMLAGIALAVVVVFRATLDVSIFRATNAAQLLHIYLPLMAIVYGVVFVALLRWLLRGYAAQSAAVPAPAD